MPPGAGSRYLFCRGVRDPRGRLLLTERQPYRYYAHRDNRVHVVSPGDTLFHLAGRYFAPLPRACRFWWVIADFQPEPIIDPTLDLAASRRTVVIPSVRVVTDVIFSDARRRQHG